MGGDDPLDQRLLGFRVRAIGGVGRDRDVDLVGDRHRDQAAFGAEHVDDVAHIPLPGGDVADLAAGRVVSHLKLGIEAGARVAIDDPLKPTDTGLPGGLEQSVDAQHQLPATRTQSIQGPDRLGLVDRLGCVLGAAGAAGQLRIDPEPQASRRFERTARVAGRADPLWRVRLHRG